MNRHSLKFVTLLSTIGFALSLTQCSSPGESNGSSIGNAVICGKLYAPDGMTPAINASVKVWDINTFSRITKEKEVRSPHPIEFVQTDDEGKFSIDRIDNGVYVIEASDQGNNMARIDSVTVGESDDSFVTDTLKTPGAITGKIVFEDINGVDTIDGYISCSATQSCSFPKNDSSFTFEPLAEGIYRVDFHFRGTYDYDPFRLLVEVSSGKTTDLGIINIKKRLPSIRGIYIDKPLIANCATIRWRSARSSISAGYNLYRRISGDTAFGQSVNGSTLITDTFFVDCTLSDGIVYEYAIRVADSSNQNGPLSHIITTSTDHVTMDLDTFDLVKPGNNTFYSLVNSKNPDFVYLKVIYKDTLQKTLKCDIQKYTADGSFIGSRSFLDNNSKIVVDESDNIYYQIQKDSTSKVMSIDAAGNQQMVVLSDEGKLINFDVFGNSIVLITELPWQQTSKSGKTIYRIKRLHVNDRTVVYSKDIEIDASIVTLFSANFYEMTLLDVDIDKDYTVRLFLDSQLRTFDSSGLEMPSTELLLGQNTSCFSSSKYLLLQFRGNTPNLNSSFYDFSVYDFSNRMQLCGEMQASWIWCSIALNGNIYMLFGDPEVPKETLCRLKNSLPKM